MKVNNLKRIALIGYILMLSSLIFSLVMLIDYNLAKNILTKLIILTLCISGATMYSIAIILKTKKDIKKIKKL